MKLGYRKAAVSGAFYPGNFDELDREIKNCFRHPLGPGNLPKKEKKKMITAAVVPHAGYTFSGPCAAHIYKRIAESEKPDSIIIVGPNHTGLGSGISIMKEGEWETPFGRAKINKELATKVWRGTDIIDLDDWAHMNEHSIEVQLPFLQFIYGNLFTFVPISISGLFYNFEICEKISKAIFKAGENRKIIVLASSDFTHYGPNYNYTFKSKNPKKKVEELDKGIINKYLEKFDAKGLLKFARSTSICGAGPIAIALLYAKYKKARKVKLKKYYNSGDILGDYSNFVGYASLIIE